MRDAPPSPPRAEKTLVAPAGRHLPLKSARGEWRRCIVRGRYELHQ